MAKLLNPLNSEGASGLYAGLVVNDSRLKSRYVSRPPADNNREFTVPQLTTQFWAVISGKLTANISAGFGRAESANETPKEFLQTIRKKSGTWTSQFNKAAKFADLREFLLLAVHIQTVWPDETILWARDFAASMPKPLPPFVENPRAPELVNASDEDMVAIFFCGLGQAGYPVAANYRDIFDNPIPWDWQGEYSPSRPISMPTAQSRAKRHEELVAAISSLDSR